MNKKNVKESLDTGDRYKKIISFCKDCFELHEGKK